MTASLWQWRGRTELDAGGNERALREILKDELSGQLVVANPVARTGGEIRCKKADCGKAWYFR